MDLAFFLFFFGIFGILLNKRHLLVIFLAIEILFLSVSLSFAFYYSIVRDVHGLIYALVLLSFAGAESAIGLSLLVVYSKFMSTIMVDSLNKLKG